MGQGLADMIPHYDKQSPAMRNFAASQHEQMPQCETLVF
jgi:hypothetical protein